MAVQMTTHITSHVGIGHALHTSCATVSVTLYAYSIMAEQCDFSYLSIATCVVCY